MATIGNVTIRIGATAKQLEYDLKRAENALKRSVANMQGLGNRLSLGVTLPLGLAGASAFKMASDVEESLNKVRVAFGQSSGEVEKFASTTLDMYGIARGTALDMSALFGDMATSMGLPQSEAANLSTSLVGLAGDLASFKNISLSEVQTALSGIFTGETESLKRLGIVVLEANLQAYALEQGITKSYKSMTQAEKVALRYQYILTQTKNAQGDFARTSDGAANQMRIFQETLKELSASLGEVLLPVITPIIRKLNEWLKAFRDLSPETKKIIVVVAGLAAALGPLLIITAQLISAVGTLKIAFISLANLSAVGAFFKLATSGALGFGLAMGKLQNIVVAFGAKLAVIAPYTIVLAAIGAAAFAVYKNFNKVTSGQEELSKALQAVNKDIAEEKIKTDVLIKTIKSETATKREKANAIERLKQIAPGYFDDLNTENINVKALNESYVKYISNIKEAAKQKAIEGKLIELETKKLDLQEKLEKQQLQLNKANKEAFTPLATGSVFQKSAVEGTLKDIKAIDDALKVLTNNLSNPLSVKSESPTTATTISLLPNAPETKTIEDEISALKKSIEKLGIAYAKTPTTGLLDNLNKQIDLLKSKESILENAEALTERLLNGQSGTIEVLPKLNFSGALQTLKDFAARTSETIRTETKKGLLDGLTVEYSESGFSQFMSELRQDLSNTQRQFDDGLISGITKTAQDFDLLKGRLDNLTKNGFGKLSPEVIAVKSELDKVGGFTGFSNLVQGVDKVVGALGAVSGVVNTVIGSFQSLFDSQIAKIDARQQREIEAINQTAITDEAKQKRILDAEKKYDKERRAIQRKQAIANKASAIFQATVAMFKGITEALAIPIVGIGLAATIGALGAANIAAIAGTPIPALAIGTDYVKNDGMAYLHKGEAVVPADVAGGGFSRQSGQLYSVVRGNDLWLISERNKALAERLR